MAIARRADEVTVSFNGELLRKQDEHQVESFAEVDAKMMSVTYAVAPGAARWPWYWKCPGADEDCWPAHGGPGAIAHPGTCSNTECCLQAGGYHRHGEEGQRGSIIAHAYHRDRNFPGEPKLNHPTHPECGMCMRQNAHKGWLNVGKPSNGAAGDQGIYEGTMHPDAPGKDWQKVRALRDMFGANLDLLDPSGKPDPTSCIEAYCKCRDPGLRPFNKHLRTLWPHIPDEVKRHVADPNEAPEYYTQECIDVQSKCVPVRYEGEG